MIEWTRMSGEKVEELLAVLLCRKYPNTTHVRPSQGDGGVDLLIPQETNKVDVYQIKKFAQNLGSSQKQQIIRSIDRFQSAWDERGEEIGSWNLLLPLDPTTDNLEWFKEQTKGLPYPCYWRGLTFIESLASEFPDVVDYYTNNGNGRHDAIINKMIKLLGLSPNDGDGVVSPSQVIPYMRELDPLLDTDPHYQYDIRLGSFNSEFKPNNVNAVAFVCKEISKDRVVTVEIIPKFKEALTFRPIRSLITIQDISDSGQREQLEKFLMYGTPLSIESNASYHIELPGGMETKGSSNAIVKIFPANMGSVEESLRFTIFTPERDEGISVIVDMQEATKGTCGEKGARMGISQNEAFSIELYFDFHTKNITFKWNVLDLVDKYPNKVLEDLYFLSNLHSPNKLSISRVYGPIAESVDIPRIEPNDQIKLESLISILESLSNIQKITDVQIRVPNLDSIDSEDIYKWEYVSRFVESERVSFNDCIVRICLKPDVYLPNGPFSIMWQSELSVSVGSQYIPLGEQTFYSRSVEIVPDSIISHGDHQDCQIQPTKGSQLVSWLERNKG